MASRKDLLPISSWIKPSSKVLDLGDSIDKTTHYVNDGYNFNNKTDLDKLTAANPTNSG